MLHKPQPLCLSRKLHLLPISPAVSQHTPGPSERIRSAPLASSASQHPSPNILPRTLPTAAPRYPPHCRTAAVPGALHVAAVALHDGIGGCRRLLRQQRRGRTLARLGGRQRGGHGGGCGNGVERRMSGRAGTHVRFWSGEVISGEARRTSSVRA